MRKGQERIELPSWAVVLLLPLLLVFLPASWSRPATGGSDFVLQVFDVGQGDSSLVQCGDVQVLIDGGPDRTVLSELGRSLPFTDRRIESVLLTHPHDDHLFGLFSVLERYEVGQLLVTEWVEELELGRELVDLAEDLEVPVVTVREGDVLELGECGRLTVLWPSADAEWDLRGSRDRTNDHSLVVRLDAADGEPLALLMGDAGTAVEQELLDSRVLLGPVRVLKVGHHGSRYSSRYDFLSAVEPSAAVMSVGADNSYGHPAQIILDRLGVLGVDVWRTDRDGTVVFDLLAGQD